MLSTPTPASSQVPLNEGAQYTIGNINVSGSSVFTEQQILRVVTKLDIIEGSAKSLFNLAINKAVSALVNDFATKVQ